MYDLIDSLRRSRPPRLLILGDIILDRYTWGDALRVSPEAPVLVLLADQEEFRLGGAASVARLATNLGAVVSLAGVIGDDAAGHTVERLLDEAGIDRTFVLRDARRPTTTKQRLLGRAADHGPHQMLRVDTERCDALPPKLERELASRLIESLTRYDAILVSDYAKGACTPSLLAELLETACDRNVPVVVDPARIADYARYRHASLLTPNRTEAQLATNIAIACPRQGLSAASRLLEECHCEAVMTTLDRDGIALVTRDGISTVVPTRPREVCDVTGAGDTVLAVAGICRARGLDWLATARLANLAAGVQVERLGVAAISWQDLAEAADQTPSARDSKILTRPQLVERLAYHRARRQRVVFTNGCFDLLHVGHVSYLHEAALLGDVLIVAINSDASVHRQKGPSRPIIGAVDRSRMLAALEAVTYIIEFDEETPRALLQELQPDVLVKGGTYRVDEVVGRDVVLAYGGEVCVAGRRDDISTSIIVDSIVARHIQPPPVTIEPSTMPGNGELPSLLRCHT